MRNFITTILIGILLCGSSAKAFSWDGHYRYGGGHYYRDVWWGFGGFLTGLAVGSYVASLPPAYETVVIDGVPYYYADGYYYQAGPGGYVIVAPPSGYQGQSVPTGNNAMFYILGILFGILLLLSIGFLLKKLLVREARST